MKTSRKFHDWLWTKAPLQGFALLVAIVAWVFVNSGTSVQQRRSVRIQYLQTPEGLSFHKTPLKNFKVNLKGSFYDVRALSDDALFYLVDLRDVKAGIHKVNIDLANLRLPLDVEAANPNPRIFNIHLEELYAKDVGVKVTLVGSPQEGYSVVNVLTNPQFVTLSGPRSIVEKLDYAEINVSLEGRSISFSSQMKPSVMYGEIEAIDPVLVEIELEPIMTTKEFKNVPVLVEGGWSADISPPETTLTLRGIQSDLENLKKRLKVEVPVAGLKRGRYRIRGKLELPYNVKLIMMHPDSFIVHLKKEDLD